MSINTNNKKLTVKALEKMRTTLEELTNEYDLKNTVILSSEEGLLTCNRDLPSDLIIRLLYGSLGQIYHFTFKENNREEEAKKWINKSIEVATDEMRKYIFEEQNDE